MHFNSHFHSWLFSSRFVVVESLIEHPGVMTHASIPAITRQKPGMTGGFIRLSWVIEALEDLKGDLIQAINY